VLPPSDQEFVAEGDDADVYVAYKEVPKLRGVNNPSSRHQGLFLLHKFRLYKSQLGRADERTRTADLISLRVIHQALQGFA
jgi:hypothetical protein